MLSAISRLEVQHGNAVTCNLKHDNSQGANEFTTIEPTKVIFQLNLIFMLEFQKETTEFSPHYKFASKQIGKYDRALTYNTPKPVHVYVVTENTTVFQLGIDWVEKGTNTGSNNKSLL